MERVVIDSSSSGYYEIDEKPLPIKQRMELIEEDLASHSLDAKNYGRHKTCK